MTTQLELNKKGRDEHTELDKEKPLPQPSLPKNPTQKNYRLLCKAGHSRGVSSKGVATHNGLPIV